MSIKELKELGIYVEQPLPDVSDIWYECDTEEVEELNFDEPI